MLVIGGAVLAASSRLRTGCELRASRRAMIPIRELVIRFLLACIALNMKVTLYPLAKFWGYRRFEPQPDSIMVTCAAVSTNQGRSAGPPQAALGRALPRAARSAAGLGRPTGWPALPLTGHAAPVLSAAGAAPTGWVTSTRWSACWACCRRRA